MLGFIVYVVILLRVDNLAHIRSHNEEEVGKALSESDIPRNEIWLPSKVAHLSRSMLTY